MKLIPKKFREATAGIAKALADPLNDFGDKLQQDTNTLLNNLAEVQSLTEEERILIQLEENSDLYAQDAFRSFIRAEVAQNLQDASKDFWKFIPEKNRKLIRFFANLTNPLANRIFDKMQAKFISDLKNFGGDNVGLLMKLIPKDIRQLTSGVASALADPIDQLVDQLQDGSNNLMRQLPQKESASEENFVTFAQ